MKNPIRDIHLPDEEKQKQRLRILRERVLSYENRIDNLNKWILEAQADGDLRKATKFRRKLMRHLELYDRDRPKLYDLYEFFDRRMIRRGGTYRAWSLVSEPLIKKLLVENRFSGNPQRAYRDTGFRLIRSKK
jgi:hypothetical protein